jgi:hypothetical protein
VTLAAITAIVSGLGYASPRRVRAICDNFTRVGLTARAAGQSDGRKRPLRFGCWFEESLLGWLDIMLAAIRPWMAWRPNADRATLLVLVYHFVARLQLQDPFLYWSDMRALTDHLAGYPLLLDIIASAALRNGNWVLTISRKRSAAVYGLSRPHIAGLISQCEQVGWFHSMGDGLAFLPLGFSRVRLWIAREFAATKLALDDHSRGPIK